MMTERGMARILTIDQGNSSAKAVVWHDGVVEDSARCFDMNIENLLPLLERGELDGCAYCSVGHKDAKFLETLRRLIEGDLLVLTPATPLPIEVRYASRATLGNDRVAAAAGAASLYPGEGALVVDAGTAVTIDVIDEKGCFHGGNIAPGLRLRLSSLHEATSQLPLVDPSGEVPGFGHDTVTAIRSGVVGGMVSEIADAFSRAASLYGCRRIVLAGNDGPILLPLLEQRALPAVMQPNLVGIGLLSVFRYNTSQQNR